MARAVSHFGQSFGLELTHNGDGFAEESGRFPNADEFAFVRCHK